MIFRVFGVRIDFDGGMSKSKDMLISKAFNVFVQQVQSCGFKIHMIPGYGSTSSSCFLLGKPYSIEEESIVDPLSSMPEGLDEHIELLKQFLSENRINITNELRGLVSAGR